VYRLYVLMGKGGRVIVITFLQRDPALISICSKSHVFGNVSVIESQDTWDVARSFGAKLPYHYITWAPMCSPGCGGRKTTSR
jgi:hypothetical protein